MRIGLFSDTFPPEINGVAASVCTLYRELTAMGHEVHVFAPGTRATAREPRVHRIASMPLIFLKERRSMIINPTLLRRVNRYRFDVIHTHSEYLVGMLGRLAARMQGCVCLHTYHTIWEDYTYYVTHGVAEDRVRRLATKLSRIWCNHCDQILAPTEKIRALLLRYGVRTPIEIIPSGLDLARFHPRLHTPQQRLAARADCGVPPENPVILNIGRIAKEKNLDAVVRAMPAVLARAPQALLVIIGEGPAADALQSLAASLGVGGSILFPGPRPWADIDRYYAMGSVFVSASTSETQGLTYIEAMASGLCVVARADPCLEGVLRDGENGLLFTDEAALPDALCRALGPDGVALGLAAPQSVARFSQAAFARSVAHCYQQTLYRMTGLARWRPIR
ncbi:MAG: glycosyltransferase [Oscillospiraceae bacterium]|jgi:1,2-diacylglycerol 3-alpha-glucosyltransferase|nr:glycosyltransferase [Oscillospiraceae bacterium]